MGVFRWGIFGTGAVSAKFVAGLAAAPGHKAVFVASRTKAQAERFAAGAGIEHVVQGYPEAARAGGVDAVYIATPPTHHADHAVACIEAGVPVLVEKPFGAGAGDAQRIADAARAAGVFAMEAMWTRFLPAARELRDRLAAGGVGEPRLIAGNFSTSKRLDPTDGSFDPLRGGGAIGQLGHYPLSLAHWLFGVPDVIQAAGRIGESGVEEDAAFQLRFADGVTGSFFCSIRAWADNSLSVMGTDGLMRLHGPIFRPFGIELMRQPPRASAPATFGWKARLRESGPALRLAQWLGTSTQARKTKTTKHLFAGNGYQYQAIEVADCIARGAIESSIMPLADSVAVARSADAIRAAIRTSTIGGQ
jgi:predicted dehydrogenase